jgi:hypothetical protein
LKRILGAAGGPANLLILKRKISSMISKTYNLLIVKGKISSTKTTTYPLHYIVQTTMRPPLIP